MTLPVLQLHSEPYSATGNLASEGARNQLGRPRLDQLAVLVRESVQNSWDAHDPDDPRISIRFDLLTLDGSRRRILRDHVLTGFPAKTEIATRLGPEGGARLMLVISDRNTSGLGGPTRADVVDKTSATDFVDFLRNIGQPPDKSLGGGTFGYGKAALYLVSDVRCIVVYTRCRYRGQLETRVMAACLGQAYTDEDGPYPTRYTGRHWWGVIDDESEIAEPLTGPQADELAAAIGMPGFEPSETGTSIAIVDFACGQERDPEQVFQSMRTALLWNFWPKMIDYGAGPAIRFSFRRDSNEIALPDLVDFPPLDGFRAAMLALKDERRQASAAHPGAVFKPIRSDRPRALLGWLCIVRFPHRARERGRPKSGALGGIEAAACHHVALMRGAELVVRYLEGPAPTTDVLDWAGVFITSDDVDRAFAASEPPTHDDWISENLSERTQRVFVNVAMRRIDEELERFAAPGDARRADAGSHPLGFLSRRLSLLLTGVSGPDAETPAIKGPRNASIAVIEDDVEDTPDSTMSAPPDGASDPGDVRSQAHAAQDMPPSETSDDVTGKAMTSVPGSNEGPGPHPASGKPRTSPGRPRLRASTPSLRVHDGIGCMVVPFVVRHGVRTTATRLRADVAAEIDGQQAEREAPVGAEVPTVLFWVDGDGNRHSHGATEIVIPAFGTELAHAGQLWVRMVEDARARARLEAEGIA